MTYAILKILQPHVPKQCQKVSCTDFQIERELGKGEFGRVYFVTKKDKKSKFYAMKVIGKTAIIENNLKENIVLEKNILQRNHHPFIVTFYYAFQNSKSICLWSIFLDIFNPLRRQKKFTEEIQHVSIWLRFV